MPCSAINDIAALKQKFPEVFVTVEHPTAGPSLQSGPPFAFSESALDYGVRAPAAVGEKSRDKGRRTPRPPRTKAPRAQPPASARKARRALAHAPDAPPWPFRIARASSKYESCPMFTRLQAPLLGEHTKEVLVGELGFTAEELSGWHDEGVVLAR